MNQYLDDQFGALFRQDFVIFYLLYVKLCVIIITVLKQL